MAACQDVRQWMTESVLIPVTQFLTEMREKCDQVQRWIEEQITQPVEQFTARLERSCRDLPWWNPLRWFCELVTIIVKVVVWVVVTVGKWVVVTVCQTVTAIISIVVTFVIRTTMWLVQFVVCLFTDPGAALLSVMDIFSLAFDVFEGVLDLVGVLLGDLGGMLEDTERLVDSIIVSLGPLGVLLGPVKGTLQWGRRLVENVRDIVGGAKDIVFGVLQGNACRLERGGLNILLSAGRGIAAGPQVLGSLAGGVRDALDLLALETTITTAVNGAFGAGTPRAARSIDTIGIGGQPMGLVFVADARRVFLSSRNAELDLRALHRAGVIDLLALAGYTTTCRMNINEPDGEVVYTGTRTRVSFADLNEFIDKGAAGVAPFQVFAITRDLFRLHLDTARRKALALGVQLRFGLIGELQASSPLWVPLASNETDDLVQQGMFRQMGRTGVNDDLSRVPSVAHFHYVPTVTGGTSRELFGLTTIFRPSMGARNPSGVTFRNRSPDWGFRFVLVHELGHYWGLDHPNRVGTALRGIDEIMFTGASGAFPTWSAVLEYLALSGEPRFTTSDATTVWAWITTDAPSLLP